MHKMNKICTNMHKNMQKNVKIWTVYAKRQKNMQQICKYMHKYAAQICQNMQKYAKYMHKYAQNMHKYANKYAK